MMNAEQWAELLNDIQEATRGLARLQARLGAVLAAHSLADADAAQVQKAIRLLYTSATKATDAFSLLNETTVVENHANDWGV